ncbi:hypothetical protein WSS_A21998 [Rhodococcus opacus M213]|uniref:Uncharacterized protein n=1 Tax=Rhodococcus opacus M213 TaxID=1129896 RepID=K8XQQ5_RHOOP|nr:hypothetical protein [Rhodococcus opacus]EKT80492.1 hypothetical protein WSS_A21998 [Rhodococcus opacus M213]
MTNPFYPQRPQGSQPGQLGQPTAGQSPKPPKKPFTPPWAPREPDAPKRNWPWIVGGIFAVLILTLGVAATVNDYDSPSAADTARNSTTARLTRTMTPEEVAARNAQQEQARRQQEEQQAKRQAAINAEKARLAAIEAAKWDRATYETLSDRDFALVMKNPDANKGRKLVVYGHVTQFDSVTGPDRFRADTMAAPQDYSFLYDNNTVVTGTVPLLTNVVSGDFVTMYVEVSGSHTYSTTLGGETTVPKLNALMLDVTGSS